MGGFVLCQAPMSCRLGADDTATVTAQRTFFCAAVALTVRTSYGGVLSRTSAATRSRQNRLPNPRMGFRSGSGGPSWEGWDCIYLHADDTGVHACRTHECMLPRPQEESVGTRSAKEAATTPHTMALPRTIHTQCVSPCPHGTEPTARESPRWCVAGSSLHLLLAWGAVLARVERADRRAGSVVGSSRRAAWLRLSASGRRPLLAQRAASASVSSVAGLYSSWIR